MPPISSLLKPFRRDKGNKNPEQPKGKRDTDPQTAAVAPSTSSITSTTPSVTTVGLRHAVQEAHVVVGIEDQATPAVDPSASPPQGKRPAAPVAPARAPGDPGACTAILPEQLWDKAYDGLKADDLELVTAYEKVLSRELKDDAPNSAAPGSVTSESQANQIEQTKPDIRRLQMHKLAQVGLKKTEKEAKTKQIIGDALQVVLSARNIVSSAMEASPQASLAWTGVCFALQILVNPVDESKANRQGIVYVMSRMKWYWHLSELLLKENIANVDEQSFTKLQSELQNRIIDLYKAVLSYQMKSVCSYYRNRRLALFRDIIKLDDWNGSLKTVQDAEAAVQKDSKVYNTMQMTQALGQLVETAKQEEAQLQHIYESLQQHSLKQIERENSREDNQCLKDLCSTNPKDDMTRIENTKGGLLRDSYVWIVSHKDFIHWRDGDETRLLWIRGDPGKGKTMLLIGVIRELQESIDPSDLLSYFFCQGTDFALKTAKAVLRGLMYQLLVQQQFLISHLREQYDIRGRQLFDDANAFIALSEIFTKMLQDPHLTNVYLIVDALDECESELSELLGLIVRSARTSSTRVKWLVSSRNQANIEKRLTIKDNKVELSLELNAKSVASAVATYIDHKVSKLKDENGYESEFCNQVRDELHQKANETFLWVALVCKELETVEERYVLEVLQEMPSDLTALYARMLEQIGKLTRRDPIYCMRVLGTSALAYRPFHVLELAAALPQDFPGKQKDLENIINLCGSFLTIRDKTVYFIHQSAKDFLIAHPLIFPRGKTEIHRTIVSRSLQLMDDKLHRDMYMQRHPGILIDQVKSVEPDPLAQIRYACAYWIDHVCEIDINLRDTTHLHDDGEIHTFFKDRFLYWLEALSLMRHMWSGATMIRTLESLMARYVDGSRLLDLVRDALRFILHNRGVMENAPLQAYASALVFSPVHSLTRLQWKKEEPEWILTKPIAESDWSLCLQTLEGHGDSVTSVVFSHDSQQLASASHDRTVKIWDAKTGKCLETLEGHGYWVTSVVFSHDSQQLASASYDRTVKIWNAKTGKCLETLEGHGDWVTSVVFSHDSQQLASASHDRTVKIWDAKTGKCLETLEGHGDWVTSVVFSHDSQQLASASRDRTVKIWDAKTGKCLETLEGHGDWVTSVVFSHDSQQLASASRDRTVKIWDAKTGKCLETLEGHGDWVTSVVFSHDSQQLASASRDRTVKIWDAKTGKCLETLEGHGYWVTSVVFSHDSQQLASASRDRTVKIWDAKTGKCLETLEGHGDWVTSVVFSHDSQQLASASYDRTVKIWDAKTGKCLETLEGHGDWVMSVVFSHDSQQLASASRDRTVKIWDAKTGKCLETLEGHGDWVTSVVFSHDSQQLASASYDRTVKIWDAKTGKCLETLEGHSDWVTSWCSRTIHSSWHPLHTIALSRSGMQRRANAWRHWRAMAIGSRRWCSRTIHSSWYPLL